MARTGYCVTEKCFSYIMARTGYCVTEKCFIISWLEQDTVLRDDDQQTGLELYSVSSLQQHNTNRIINPLLHNATYAIGAHHHQRYEFQSCSCRSVLDTTLCDLVCQ